MVGPNGQNTQFHTLRVDEPDLVKQLADKGVKFTGKSQGSLLGSILAWILPVAIMFALWNFFMMRMGSGGPGVLSIGQSKAKLVADSGAKRITFNDVAGIDEAREELQEVVDFLKTPQRFETLGGRIPRGILLVGAPGTGKTLLAKAVAGEAGVPFFSISGSEFVEMFVGVGAARVRDLFAQAGSKAPCIIFIDELDALGKARGYSPMGGYDEREQTLNQLLTEMDGFDTRKGVIIMGATNRPEILDPALLRPGRFDRQVVVDRPDLVGREAILQRPHQGREARAGRGPQEHRAAHAGLRGRGPCQHRERGGAACGAPIEDGGHLRRSSARPSTGWWRAWRRRSGSSARGRRRSWPSTNRVTRSWGTAWAARMPCRRSPSFPAASRRWATPSSFPRRTATSMTKKELEEKLASLLGGRVAEEVFFNDVSTGAQNDLFKATDIARAMVKEYGMSTRMGSPPTSGRTTRSSRATPTCRRRRNTRRRSPRRSTTR